MGWQPCRAHAGRQGSPGRQPEGQVATGNEGTVTRRPGSWGPRAVRYGCRELWLCDRSLRDVGGGAEQEEPSWARTPSHLRAIVGKGECDQTEQNPAPNPKSQRLNQVQTPGQKTQLAPNHSGSHCDSRLSHSATHAACHTHSSSGSQRCSESPASNT